MTTPWAAEMRAVIRLADPADVDAVAVLDADCFGDGAWNAASWAEEFGKLGDSRVILVAEARALVGYIVLLVPASTVDPVDLTRVAVAPAHRRTGIGGELVAAALRQVPDRTVLLEVAEGNKAARVLYRRFGFAEFSRRRAYYRGREDAVIMRWQGDVRD
jgi:[ribosomal protein S18]-alanine N-acetyltransferase